MSVIDISPLESNLIVARGRLSNAGTADNFLPHSLSLLQGATSIMASKDNNEAWYNIGDISNESIVVNINEVITTNISRQASFTVTGNYNNNAFTRKVNIYQEGGAISDIILVNGIFIPITTLGATRSFIFRRSETININPITTNGGSWIMRLVSVSIPNSNLLLTYDPDGDNPVVFTNEVVGTNGSDGNGPPVRIQTNVSADYTIILDLFTNAPSSQRRLIQRLNFSFTVASSVAGDIAAKVPFQSFKSIL